MRAVEGEEAALHPHQVARGRRRLGRHAGRPTGSARPAGRPGCAPSPDRQRHRHHRRPAAARAPSSAIRAGLPSRPSTAGGGGGPGLFLGAERLGLQVGARQGGGERRQAVRQQAAFLQQHGDRRLVAQRGAVIGRPPAPARRGQRGGEGRLGARRVVRQRQRRAELRLGQRRRQLVRSSRPAPARRPGGPGRRSASTYSRYAWAASAGRRVGVAARPPRRALSARRRSPRPAPPRRRCARAAGTPWRRRSARARPRRWRTRARRRRHSAGGRAPRPPPPAAARPGPAPASGPSGSTASGRPRLVACSRQANG